MARHFLFLGATTLLLLLSLCSGQVVFDLFGNPVEVGTEYYIFRVEAGFRESVKRAPSTNGDALCPQYATDSITDRNFGDTVRFIPINSTRRIILESSDVQIDSGTSAICRSSGLWTVEHDQNGLNVVVTAGGSALPASFQLVRAGQWGPADLPVYQINYCLNCDNPDADSFNGPLTMFRSNNFNFLAFHRTPQGIFSGTIFSFVRKTDALALRAI